MSKSTQMSAVCVSIEASSKERGFEEARQHGEDSRSSRVNEELDRAIALSLAEEEQHPRQSRGGNPDLQSDEEWQGLYKRVWTSTMDSGAIRLRPSQPPCRGYRRQSVQDVISH